MKLFRVAPINFRQHDFIIKVMLLYTCFKERLLIKSLTRQPCLDWVVFFKDIYLWEQGRLQSACGVNSFFQAEAVVEMPVLGPHVVGGRGCPVWKSLWLGRHNSLPAVILLSKYFLSSFSFPFDPTEAEPACRPSQDRSLSIAVLLVLLVSIAKERL